VLSAREAELAELAAQGLSNAEIAERLVLSVRSVETYLYRAMHKLGVNDRRDLRRAVRGASAPGQRRIAS
jgi:DNA-binding CsgD family transcriptional regulator